MFTQLRKTTILNGKNSLCLISMPIFNRHVTNYPRVGRVNRQCAAVASQLFLTFTPHRDGHAVTAKSPPPTSHPAEMLNKDWSRGPPSFGFPDNQCIYIYIYTYIYIYIYICIQIHTYTLRYRYSFRYNPY